MLLAAGVRAGRAADGHPHAQGSTASRPPAASPPGPDLASVHVVILTTFDLDEYVFEGLRTSAAGFLVKDTRAAELIRAVRVAASGDALLSPAVTRRLIAEFALRTARSGRAACPPAGRADPREREVLSLIATGLSNDEISRKIFVSPATVKNPRQPGHDQSRGARPGPARHLRLRGRASPTGYGLTPDQLV